MEAVSTSETSISTRLHNAITQKALVFKDKGAAPLLNEDVLGSGGVTPHILNLSTTQGRMVSLTLWLLNPCY
jgi:hypothetical protein